MCNKPHRKPKELSRPKFKNRHPWAQILHVVALTILVIILTIRFGRQRLLLQVEDPVQLHAFQHGSISYALARGDLSGPDLSSHVQAQLQSGEVIYLSRSEALNAPQLTGSGIPQIDGAALQDLLQTQIPDATGMEDPAAGIPAAEYYQQPATPLTTQDKEIKQDDVDDPYNDSLYQTVLAQMLVLGYHNTGTSMLTKLILLMGAYGGPRNSLLIGENNKLKYFERGDVIGANQDLMGKYAKALQLSNAMVMTQGYHWDRTTANPNLTQPLSNFHSRVDAIVSDLNRKPVWVTKDPRLCMTLPLWMTHLTRPVCVVVFKSPIEVAFRMASHKKAATGLRNPGVFIAHQQRFILQALQNCRGRPTLLLPAGLTAVPHHKILLGFILKEAVRAGITDLHFPRAEQLYEHYEQYFHPKQTERVPKYQRMHDTCGMYNGLSVEKLQINEDDFSQCDISEVLERFRNVKLFKAGLEEVQVADTNSSKLYRVQHQIQLTPYQKGLLGTLEEVIQAKFQDRLDVGPQELSEYILMKAREKCLDVMGVSWWQRLVGISSKAQLECMGSN